MQISNLPKGVRGILHHLSGLRDPRVAATGPAARGAVVLTR